MSEERSGVPAGWYPDPLGLPQLRWWDSAAWTEHTSELRSAAVDETASTGEQTPDVVAASVHVATVHVAAEAEAAEVEATPSVRRRFEVDDDDDPMDELSGDALLAAMRGEASVRPAIEVPAFVASTATSPVDRDLSAQPLLAMTLKELEPPLAEKRPSAGPRRASFHTNADRSVATLSSLADDLGAAPERQTKGHRTYTTAVWIIAVMPFLQLSVSLVLIAAGFGQNQPLMILVWGAPYFIVIALAAFDALVQQVWGRSDVASLWWATLTAPVYLVVRAIRSIRQTGKGFAPVALWSAGAVAVLVGVIAVPGLIIGVAPAQFSSEVEAVVAADAEVLGADLTVDCPSTVPVVVGDSFTCIGTKPDGSSDSISVMLQRESGWIGWRVTDWGSWVLAY